MGDALKSVTVDLELMAVQQADLPDAWQLRLKELRRQWGQGKNELMKMRQNPVASDGERMIATMNEDCARRMDLAEEEMTIMMEAAQEMKLAGKKIDWANAYVATRKAQELERRILWDNESRARSG